MLGPGSVPRFHSTDPAFQAAGRQPLHIGVDFNFSGIPFGYRVDIDQVDTSAENGSTEVWLGSHVDTDVRALNKARVIRHELLG